MARTEIQAKLGLDTTAFQRGLAKSQKGIGNFVASGIKKFGALAGAAGLGAMAKSAIDLGSKISDLAVQLNIGTTELQVLDFASREAGVGTEIMARALRNVQLRTEEAIKGNKSYGDAFKQLGIDIEVFKQLKTEEKMEAIAKAQENATDKAAAYNSVSRILGEKAGPALQEVLQNLAGPQGFDGLADAAERAGEVMSKETIKKMDDAADRIESFKRKMTVLTGEILAKAVPAFQTFSGGISFVSSGLAFLVLSLKSFTTFLGTSFAIVIQPAISNLQSFGKAIEAAALAATGNFDDAKKAMLEVKELSVSAFSELLTIPDQISKEFADMQTDMSDNVDMMTDDFEGAASKIGGAWSEMFGTVKEESKNATDAVAADAKKTAKELKQYVTASSKSTEEAATESTSAVKETTEALKELGESSKKSTEATAGLEKGFVKVKKEAQGFLLIAKDIQSALGYDQNVGSKGTDILRKELDFTKGQLKEIQRFIDTTRGMPGQGESLAVKMERAQVQAQADRIQAELDDRQKFSSLGGVTGGYGALAGNGWTFEDIQRIQSHNAVSNANRDQNDILRRIQEGIDGINNTTSKLDRNLTG